jgi:hypothetical protein
MEITNEIEQVFKPLLKQFCERTKTVEIDSHFSTVFLPHTMTNYSTAKKKIFYFGRDTCGWTPTRQLFQAHNNDCHLSYLKETSKWANEFGFLEYNNNKSSAFWTLAMRLHLRLKGFTENLKISENLPKQYYEQINDFGWGNTNSIEVPKSLEKQRVWEKLDKKKYWAVKEQSKPIDKLIHTIKAYKPDLVFIFNWDCNEKLFLEGLNYQETKVDLFSNHFLTYHLPDTKTRVVWTLHPTAARWFGYGTDKIIDEIVNYIKTIDA